MEGFELSSLLTDLPLNLINILLLYLIVSKLIYKPVKKLLDDRARRLQEQRNAADAAKAEADEKSRRYDELLAGAKEVAARITADAREDAQRQTQQTLADARAEAQKLLADARTQAQAAHDEALTGLQDEVAGLAVDIAGKVLERTVTDADTRRLADEFFAAEQPAAGDGTANA